MKQRLKQLKLNARMANYLHRNNKLSPLHRKEYLFLKNLYIYLTKQITNQKFKEQLYQEYTELIDILYFPNRDSVCPEMAETIYLDFKNLLYREMTSKYTFIQLNSIKHYQHMLKIVELIYNWTLNEDKGSFMDPDEFQETIDFLRKEFNKDKMDLNYYTGKWPKKFRKRFKRK